MRKNYAVNFALIQLVRNQNLAGRLSRLKKTCPAGKAMAEKVINYHLTKYRNRPALREELQKVR